MLGCFSVGLTESIQDEEAIAARMGGGPCSLPGCSADGYGVACTGYLGTANENPNCGHGFNYHA